MALVDQAAAVAAIRHAGGPAVTASIDRVDFRERIPVGSLVTCEATVDFVGNTSMDITVEVYAEKVSTGERRHTHTAHVVFVAIDEDGQAQAGAPAHPRDRRGARALRPGRGPPAEQAAGMSGRAVAVVLSGGGAKTAAHLGAVRALGEAGLDAGPLRGDVDGRGGRRRAGRRHRAGGDARAAGGGRAPAASSATAGAGRGTVRPVAAPAGAVPAGDRGAGARPPLRRARACRSRWR